MVQRLKALVVIDGLEKNVSSIIKAISSSCKKGSKVLITSQDDNNKLQNKVHIDFLSKELSSKILNDDLEEYCPKDVFDKILKNTNGHPLMLTIINKMIQYENFTWDDIKKDVEGNIVNYQDDASGKAFFVRLLKNYLDSIALEIYYIKWINNQYIEEDLLSELIGIGGVKKLRDRSLLNTSNKRVIKIHDIVFKSIIFMPEDAFEKYEFNHKLIEFLNSRGRVKDPAYFRVIHIHKDKLLSLLANMPLEPSILYASVYIYDFENDIDELKNIFKNIEESHIFKCGYTYKKNDYFLILSYVECIEIIHRRIKIKNKAEAKDYAKQRIRDLIKLKEITNLDKDIFYEITHHLGKLYSNSEDEEKALKCFEQVIENVEDSYHSMLQLVRLLRERDTFKSKEYLNSIFEAYKNKSDVSITIVLASFDELRWKEFKDERNKYLNSERFFEDVVNDASLESFDYPFRVMAGVGKNIAYNSPERFVEILELMPIPSEETQNQKLLFLSGELYKELGKSYRQLGRDNDAVFAFEQAEAYYSKVKSPYSYQRRMISELYILQDKPSEAIDMLEKIEEKERICYWYHRYSQALRLQGNLDDALFKIELAIRKMESGDEMYKSAFYYEKGKILYLKSQKQAAKEAFVVAVTNSDNEKFRATIEKEIQACN